jgi:hypothetical protein
MTQIYRPDPFRLPPASAQAAAVEQNQGLPPHLAAIAHQAMAQANGLAGLTVTELDSLRRDHRWQMASAFLAGGIVGGALWGITNPPKPPTIVSQPGPVQTIETPVIVERNCIAFCGKN